MACIVIHPGFAKTGTTTLQDRLFGPCADVGCFAKPYAAGSEDFMEARDAWAQRLAAILGIGVEAVRRRLDGAHAYARPDVAKQAYRRWRSTVLIARGLSRLPGVRMARRATDGSSTPMIFSWTATGIRCDD